MKPNKCGTFRLIATEWSISKTRFFMQYMNLQEWNTWKKMWECVTVITKACLCFSCCVYIECICNTSCVSFAHMPYNKHLKSRAKGRGARVEQKVFKYNYNWNVRKHLESFDTFIYLQIRNKWSVFKCSKLINIICLTL